LRPVLIGYRHGMDAPENENPGVTDLFDDVDEGQACRVCGALVPRAGTYAQAHWAWHEATNGA
jgi:rubredoxin